MPGRRSRRHQNQAADLRAAALHYVNPALLPGIRRRRSGRGFTYSRPDGSTIHDRAELRRIRALVIPPAWRDVWISPSPEGHLQAVGRDARGRRQYRYHARWRRVRDERKFDRTLAFAETLPAIRLRWQQPGRAGGPPSPPAHRRIRQVSGLTPGDAVLARKDASTAQVS
ncbi:MAG TPA: hypothetical protein VLS25_02825 [Dehalococcoidia bacterium]|nr:hypothetical protein [Dehalococcoidia bacterium]